MNIDYRNTTEDAVPEWLGNKGQIDEPLFCQKLIEKMPLRYIDNMFYSLDGMVNEDELTSIIFNMIKGHARYGSARKTEAIIKTLRLYCYHKDFRISDKEIHVKNGILRTDGTFSEERCFCRNRLDVVYDPSKGKPEKFLRFLSGLLDPDDILTLQEYLGYCLIPTTIGQKAMFIIGNGGEGKSCIVSIVQSIFGQSAVTGRFHALETDKFSRYKLINKLVMIDDELHMAALPSTGVIKNLITARIPVEVEAKGKQSSQATLYARFLCLGNGSPRALYDKSDGFTRRMLILTTKPVSPGRVLDPDITSKLVSEKDSIFLWMFEGLQRLISNNYEFTISGKTKANLDDLAAENCNIAEYLDDIGYISFAPEYSATSNDLYGGYSRWCGENGITALKQDTFTGWLKNNSERYGIKYDYNIPNRENRRVRGFRGIRTSYTPILT
ncbi:MAG: DNA primase [Oribacterium sp.]|nr:DNA primase [Oribacterium sp.]